MIPGTIVAQLEHQKLVSSQIASSFDDLYHGGRDRITRRRLDARLSALNEDWQEFSSNHKCLGLAIAELPEDVRGEVKNDPYFIENSFRTTREIFLNSFEKMTTLLDEIQDGSSSSDPSQHLHAPSSTSLYHRLPHMDLPKFNGDFAEWLTFRDIFISLVFKNQSLSPVEKLFYLRSSLTGSAALLLKHTPLTGDNFEKAWRDLTSYYDNKRILIDSTLYSLFSLKCIQNESATELEELYTSIQQNIRLLETLGQPVQHWDSLLVYFTTRCLDSNTYRAWELELGSSTEYPKWSQLSNFLVSRIRSLQALTRASSFQSTNQIQSGPKLPTPLSHTRQSKSHSVQQINSTDSIMKTCPICTNDHFTYKCPEYTSKSTDQKLNVIKQKNLCFNCLGTHLVRSCPSSRRCIKCGKKHHTSIHTFTPKVANDLSDNSPQYSTLKSTDDLSNKQVTHLKPQNPPFRTSILLATARAKVELEHGQLIYVRILIDQGSEISLVTESLVQMYRIPRRKSCVSIIGAGALPTGRSKGSVSLKLKSNYNSDYYCLMIAEILPKLTSIIPSSKVHNPTWEHLTEIDLADPNFFDPSSVDIILGSDLYHEIIENGLKRGKEGEPIAQLTSFGWILSGPTGQTSSVNNVQGYHCSCERDWYALIEEFWREGEVTDSKPPLTPDEEECENHFRSTHKRVDTGQYQVRLPFKDSVTLLGDSKLAATKALHKLFRQFATNPVFYKEYAKFINDYQQLGHMALIPSQFPEPTPVNYIPHHGVFSHDFKLRVVFNGTAKVSNGTPLNDLFHIGAKLQIDLVDVLLYFRQFRFVFSTDVEKMYRQILVHPDDWCFQRILWKDSLGNIETYNLTTVTYGLSCSPFLALRTVNQLINDEGENFPLAVPVLMKGRYVDDTFGGGDTVQESQSIVQQVTNLCMAGGFPLRKWISNHPDILNSIPAEHKLPIDSLSIDNPISISALGLSWQPSEDIFTFSPITVEAAPFTKRSISSKIARLFDPLGFIAPIVIKAKILLQKLWIIGVGWDEPIPKDMIDEWVKFIQQLSDLKQLRFPRWIGITGNCNFQLHGFSDASRVGISAVLYLRVSLNSNVTVSFVCAKTKVAPIKRLTIPRLELSAATLLTRLTNHVCRTLDLNNPPLFLWTDSAIVHTWVNNHPSKWKDYVHNRVCFIQETLPLAQWKFIPGMDNPADCASRGMTPIELLANKKWWNGPSWLAAEPTYWPGNIPAKPLDNLLEIKQTNSVNVIRTPVPKLWSLIERYSSFTKLLRITAICYRVIKKFRHRFDGPITSPLTPEELVDAKYYWVHQVQLAFYPNELTTLSNKENLPKQNSLIRLMPFIDEKGILRVGGRLINSELSYENKHPFILPRTCSLSNLIISDAHSRTLHGSTQSTLTYIRTTCWIVGGRAPVRSLILKCIKCSIWRKKNAQQMMGQLPFTRVTRVDRPFIHTGLDYAGPFSLKTWKGRAAKLYKAYFALFVCQSTSAIHIELVTDYTTEAFLAAYQRFVSRRGICQTISSDCGTNLKGADAELKRLFAKTSYELGNLASLIANDGTKWLFNPPAAPHFGGKWEAAVKSVKYHLRRVVGDTLLTYEEMTTLLTQIEAVLNSRPLCPITDDPDDLSVLTPGHFLIGTSLTATPEPTLEGININRLSRWQRIQQMRETFWTRWSRECLQRYQAVYKWNHEKENISIGTIVLIMDERYPPTKWPLGRIIQVHPGKDGRVRVATVKTETSTVTRPIVKLCPLPVETSAE
ncbi:uncharacterized protein LOC122506102 [Leptopilina heterotoma]|uniref:uncharacterized protein LOC122506102 n=1 Tax=Leptopilina heterotoma TaxID=63436 RepID=UPI001CA9CC79|nr:uncharacterized protein LOC122506102 [Leptopilina heterotoma]